MYHMLRLGEDSSLLIQCVDLHVEGGDVSFNGKDGVLVSVNLNSRRLSKGRCTWV